MKINPVVSLSDKEIDDIVRKYHFLPDKRAEIAGVFHTIENIIKPVIYYETDDKLTGFDFINNEMHQKIIYCVMSLGRYVDDIQDVLVKAGDLYTATVVDDICLEILMKMYSVIAGEVSQRYNMWIERYLFAGEHFEIEKMPLIINAVGAQAEVTCNEFYNLQPVKTTVLCCILSDKSKECGNKICANCSNVNCDMREC